VPRSKSWACLILRRFEKLRPAVEGSSRVAANACVPVPLVALESAPPEARETPESERLPSPRDFETLYATHFRHVTRWVRAFGCPPADIEDVAQETFLILRRHLPKLQVEKVAGWLFRVARRATKSHRRRVWVSRVLYLEPETPSLGTQPCPVEALEQRDARRQMQSLLSRMTERRRTTFFLFEIEGYTGEEIAALEGVPASTIYTRLHHARRDFMKLLAESQELEEVTP